MLNDGKRRLYDSLAVSSQCQSQRRETNARERQEQRGSQCDEWLWEDRSPTKRGSNRDKANSSQQPEQEIFRCRARRKQSAPICFTKRPDCDQNFRNEREGEYPGQSDQQSKVLVQKLE